MESKTKKKGFFATIWESMTKTGGCCGSGESCCGPTEENTDKPEAEKKTTPKPLK